MNVEIEFSSVFLSICTKKVKYTQPFWNWDWIILEGSLSCSSESSAYWVCGMREEEHHYNNSKRVNMEWVLKWAGESLFNIWRSAHRTSLNRKFLLISDLQEPHDVWWKLKFAVKILLSLSSVRRTEGNFKSSSSSN